MNELGYSFPLERRHRHRLAGRAELGPSKQVHGADPTRQLPRKSRRMKREREDRGAPLNRKFPPTYERSSDVATSERMEWRADVGARAAASIRRAVCGEGFWSTVHEWERSLSRPSRAGFRANKPIPGMFRRRSELFRYYSVLADVACLPGRSSFH